MDNRKYMTLRQKTYIKLFFKLLFILLMGALIFFICDLTAAGAKYNREKIICTYIIGTLIWLWVVYMTKFIPLLFARDWDGEIISVHHRAGWYCPYAIFGRGGIKPTVYIDLVIKKDNGRNKKITYNAVHISPSYYFNGMKVSYKKGAKFLVYKDPPEDKIICPVCTSTLEKNCCGRCKINF